MRGFLHTMASALYNPFIGGALTIIKIIVAAD
jgi:hypothetical protein